MKKYLLFLTILLVGCSTIATQSKDGKTLKIKGSGKAVFENGASIEGGTFIPTLPQVKLQN